MLSASGAPRIASSISLTQAEESRKKAEADRAARELAERVLDLKKSYRHRRPPDQRKLASVASHVLSDGAQLPSDLVGLVVGYAKEEGEAGTYRWTEQGAYPTMGTTRSVLQQRPRVRVICCLFLVRELCLCLSR